MEQFEAPRISHEMVETDGVGRYRAIQLGTAEFENACRYAAEKQTVKYAVAPGQAITIGHKMFTAYQEITLADMQNPSLHPKDAMQDLINRGVVLKKKGIL